MKRTSAASRSALSAARAVSPAIATITSAGPSAGSARRRLRPGFDLAWMHDGRRYRVTPWPELAFEVETSDGWKSCEPDPTSDVFAEAAATLGRTDWQRFLEFLPEVEREFVAQFRTGRLAALALLARCPRLARELAAGTTPALVALIAAHRLLRGTFGPRWEEIRAVHERSGLFGVLEWLGLPASRQTLAILGRIEDPDLPRRLLEPIRRSLWAPESIWLLQRGAALTERELTRCCHALAA